MKTEDIRNMAKAYAAVLEKAKMDPVNPSELKGKHKDRKDKDIDNDGDVDSTDKYLHKRRKAVSKAIKKDNSANNDTDVQTQEANESVELDEKKGALHLFDNEADARKKQREVGGKVIKGTGKSAGKWAVKEEVELDENYRKLATKGMGTEYHPKHKFGDTTKVGRGVDYYHPKTGDKGEGKIVKTTDTHYHVKDNKSGQVHKFAYLDREKAKKLMGESVEQIDEISADLAKRTLAKRDAQADAASNRYKRVSKAFDRYDAKRKKEKDANYNRMNNPTASKETEKRTSAAAVARRDAGDKSRTLNKKADKSYDYLKKRGHVESFNIDEAAKGTAQHKPDEKTRDTWEKQLSTRKGEKDFKDQHKSEVPAAGDEPKIDALNFQKFKSMVAKKDNSRPADQKKGDNKIIPSATPVKGA